MAVSEVSDKSAGDSAGIIVKDGMAAKGRLACNGTQSSGFGGVLTRCRSSSLFAGQRLPKRQEKSSGRNRRQAEDGERRGSGREKAGERAEVVKKTKGVDVV